MVKMSLLSKYSIRKVLYLNWCRYNGNFCRRVNPVHKRGSVLSDMVKDRDKRKNWHFEIFQNHVKSKNVFEKVSKPSRRQNVLNNLFIENITDVLSTGDVAPEILGYGIEITGVKVSPCCQMVNVYWQIPPNKYSSDVEIATILNQNAPKLRAELISRNVMGRVPRIHFVRDATNAYVSGFEKALKEVDLGSAGEGSIIPDDSFTKEIYKFKDSKDNEDQKVQEKCIDPPKKITKKNTSLPERPHDMKYDVFGLNHDILMGRVVSSRTKSNSGQSSYVIDASEWDKDADLFSKIPGTPIHEDADRGKLLKQFHIERKKLRNKKNRSSRDEMDSLLPDFTEQDYEAEPVLIEEDFIDENYPERF